MPHSNERQVRQGVFFKAEGIAMAGAPQQCFTFENEVTGHLLPFWWRVLLQADVQSFGRAIQRQLYSSFA